MINEDSSLDDMVTYINEIYEQSNSERDFTDIILMFFEDIGRCFQLTTRKREDEVVQMLPSMFKWFCTLYSKSDNKSVQVSDMLWLKFPNICPYCKDKTCSCKVGKEILDIAYISKISEQNKKDKPKNLNDWQNHFQKIYPRNMENSSYVGNVSHLAEELAELSEAYRKSYLKKDIPCVQMELADVFSWIVGLANLIHGIEQAKKEKGIYRFGDVIFNEYKKGCPKCASLRSTTGLEKCCCSVSNKKLRLISDYDYDEMENVSASPLSSCKLKP